MFALAKNQFLIFQFGLLLLVSASQVNNINRVGTDEAEQLNLFQKARCVIPNGIEHVARTLLLQQCLSKDFAQGNETRCYEELGCFPMDSPWTSILRPLPSPMSPNFIDVHIYLYTRAQNTPYDVPLWPKVDLEHSDFNPKRKNTVFITHGFSSSTNSSWMTDMKNAYLKKVDANIFLVDWSKGASSVNYLQVASNTRIVGAELSRLVLNLTHLYDLEPRSIHLIGHSLGAQISGYCAKKVPNIARLTALDPAQPGFEGTPTEVRLAKGDANFTEVIHTSARPLVPTLGFGMISSVGDVDFYANGGVIQPGCRLPDVSSIPKISSINDLAKIPVEVLSEWVSCSHGRSSEYYIAALAIDNCTFWGHQTGIVRHVANSGTLGALDPVISSLTSCSAETCIPLNLDTPRYKARGVFSLSTEKEAPFCINDPSRDKRILKEIHTDESSVVSDFKETLSNYKPSLKKLI